MLEESSCQIRRYFRSASVRKYAALGYAYVAGVFSRLQSTEASVATTRPTFKMKKTLVRLPGGSRYFHPTATQK